MKRELDPIARSLGVTCTGVLTRGELCAARFLLGNGLRVVLLLDGRAELFAYQTWFRVGSKHEDPTRTGMAHLFEHLMFKGTTRYQAGVFDREMERRGGETNAATWVDWTYYLETLAARADNLATVVAFESDRMANLVLDRKTFESELEVVKNERRMTVDDSVVGELSERLYARAFRAHPYRWPTIGAMTHLESATPADLERFYRTFYAPNNATVVVAGDIDAGDTLELIIDGYGSLSPQTIPPPPAIIEPRQEHSRQVTLERPVMASQILLGFHAPAQLDPDFAAAEMLGEVLVVGDNGRLYRRLVTEEGLASDVVGYLAPFAEPGLYEILVTARPGVDPQRVIDVTQEELDGLVVGLSSQEANKARNGLELFWHDSLKDAEGCAEALGHYESNYADFRLAFTGDERWGRVSGADLTRVAADLFRSTNRTAIVAVPEAG